jgi:hypothetical protein
VRRGKRRQRAGWRGNRGRPRLPWTPASDDEGRARGREQAAAVMGGPRWVGARGVRGGGWAATGGGYRRRGVGVGRGRHSGVRGRRLLFRIEGEKDIRKMLPGGGYFE